MTSGVDLLIEDLKKKYSEPKKRDGVDYLLFGNKTYSTIEALDAAQVADAEAKAKRKSSIFKLNDLDEKVAAENRNNR